MRYRWLVVLVAMAGFLSWHLASSSGSAQHTRSITTFTCCKARDVNRVYHPGDVVAVHWIRETDRGVAPTYPVAVTLRAHLDGGFATISQAKALPPNDAARERARPIVVTDQTNASPVSHIRIPTTATSGLYNLTTIVSAYGGTVSGTTTVHVVAN
jgi:hypothetical protein